MNRLKRKIIWNAAMALLFLVSVSACKKDTFTHVPGVCPVVLSTSPSQGTTNVSLVKVIEVTFNKPMNPATINEASFFIQGSPAIAGVISYNGNTAYFRPSERLLDDHLYTGTISTAVKDMAGNALQEPFIWTFKTVKAVPPLIVATSPANLATNVPRQKVISATFDQVMDSASVKAAFTVMLGAVPVQGRLSYSNKTILFTPVASLLADMTYTVKIARDAMNPLGVPMTRDSSWTFKTGAGFSPVITSGTPSGGAGNVPLKQVIVASFDQAMDANTLPGSFTIMRGTAQVNGTVSYSGLTASFTPLNDLLPNTTYTAKVTTAAESMAGYPLDKDYVWSFTTVAAPGPNPQFVELESVERFGIIAGVGVSNNAGLSQILNMDVGISPGVRSSVVGFPPGLVVNGAIYASDDLLPMGIGATLTQAKQDLTDAYLFAEGATAPAPATVAGDQGGLTLTPGIYKSTSTLLVQGGDLTLDAGGDQNAVWIFQIASDFTTVGGAGGNIILKGNAQARNIFWQVGRSATIGDNTSFQGNVLALTSITMGSGSTATGRMLAINGAVVMTSTNTINKP